MDGGELEIFRLLINVKALAGALDAGVCHAVRRIMRDWNIFKHMRVLCTASPESSNISR